MKNNCTGVHWKRKVAEKIVQENFEGLGDLIDDKDILQFYKDLIVTCMMEYSKKVKPKLLK